MFDSMPAVRPIEAAQRTFLQRVFAWMGTGLGITALVAWTVSTNESTVLAMGRGTGLLLLLVTVGLVFAIQGAAARLKPTLAATLFVAYSGLMGLALSWVFLVYTQDSLASTFVATAATFGACAAYGAMTKKDLSSWGSLLFMALIGIVIASVVNVFLRSSGLAWAVSIVGVFVFTGLTAYDMQRLKRIHAAGTEGGAADRGMAIVGALVLYLDFVNLFLILLRFMGDRRR